MSRGSVRNDMRGRYGVEDWLRIYADHCHDHAVQVRRAVRQG